MATRMQFTISEDERRNRTFSESFKREKVRELELGLIRPTDLMKQYAVSHMSVYRWISKYGSMKHKKERLIVESQSDTIKLIEANKRIAELERLLGQKQILLDFKDKMIEIAEKEYGVDIKKNASGKASVTTGKTGKK